MADFRAAVAEAYASAPQDRIILHTLEIHHHSLAEPIRACNWPVTDNEPTIFSCRLEESAPVSPGELADFVGLPFEITLPEQSSEDAGQFGLRVSGVGPELDDHLDRAVMAGGPITATYRTYIKGEEGVAPDEIYEDIQIHSPDTKGQDVSAQGAVLDWIDTPFSILYTPENSPALVRNRNA